MSEHATNRVQIQNVLRSCVLIVVAGALFLMSVVGSIRGQGVLPIAFCGILPLVWFFIWFSTFRPHQAAPGRPFGIDLDAHQFRILLRILVSVALLFGGVAYLAASFYFSGGSNESSFALNLSTELFGTALILFVLTWRPGWISLALVGVLLLIVIPGLVGTELALALNIGAEIVGSIVAGILIVPFVERYDTEQAIQEYVSDIDKDQLTVTFGRKLPVSAISGVGMGYESTLAGRGVTTIEDLIAVVPSQRIGDIPQDKLELFWAKARVVTTLRVSKSAALSLGDTTLGTLLTSSAEALGGNRVPDAEISQLQAALRPIQFTLDHRIYHDLRLRDIVALD